MVPIALLRALPSIFHRAALALMAKTLLLTLLLFAMLGGLLWFAFHTLLAKAHWGDSGFAEAAATAIAIVALGWLLFRTVAMAVMALFADDIVVAVERDAYPDAAIRARPVGLSRSVGLALRSVGRALAWNLLALPLYLLLLITGIGTIVLFLAVNAYLLGRDMADMVVPRHPDLPRIGAFDRWLMGLVSALLFLVPVVNLFAPILSAAMAVHMLHGPRKKPA
ncbi:MAG: EI24 domain-containing protein [Sphingobium sp.]